MKDIHEFIIDNTEGHHISVRALTYVVTLPIVTAYAIVFGMNGVRATFE